MNVTGRDVPAPGDVHPAYRDHPSIVEWVNGTGPWAGMRTVRLPIRHVSWRFLTGEPDVTTVPHFSYHTLDLHRCAGPAPYVGEPFAYEWWVAVDELGRMVAGEASQRRFFSYTHRLLADPC